jgi:hypothetical protein
MNVLSCRSKNFWERTKLNKINNKSSQQFNNSTIQQIFFTLYTKLRNKKYVVVYRISYNIMKYEYFH